MNGKSMDVQDRIKFKSNLLRVQDQDQKQSAFATNAIIMSFIDSFHKGDSVQNQIDIAKFILAHSNCQDVIILRIVGTALFRIYFRGQTPSSTPETYAIADFKCVQNLMNKNEDDEDMEASSVLTDWKPLFTYVPTGLVAVRISQLDQRITAIIAISFKRRSPPNFMTQKFPLIKEILTVVTPYAMILQSSRDNVEESEKMQIVNCALEAISSDKNQRSPENCAITIARELSKITSCYTASVYQLYAADKHFLRVFTTAAFQRKTKGDRTCPNPLCHESDTFPYSRTTEPLGWVAVNRKILKINDDSECADYNLPRRALHSSLSCSCMNVLCVPINDHTAERNIVIELTNKAGGFTQKDIELTTLLAQKAAVTYSCSVNLAPREKPYRPNSLLCQMISKNQPVKQTKIEQFLNELRKITPSKDFGGSFLEFTFSIKSFPDWKMAGWIVHAFVDLDLLNTFKIRKSTLIRFIIAAQQGYRPLPYHNWQHACSVAHFGYCMIKNIKLLEDDYITPLEAFALIVSGLLHDIDHRGTNNRFQSSSNSELYQIYNTDESIMERHHLAIALSILRREDCNILENLSAEDYKEFVELLTWNILATDIVKYLQSRELNFSLLRNLKRHRREEKLSMLSLMMTASDVNDCVKPWDNTLVSATQVLTEFFDQGDLEKDLGLSPMPMMDRNSADIPEVEYKFISAIVLPVFSVFAARFPCMKAEEETLERYKENWEISTLIFDAHKDNPDQLSILALPEMKEANLRKIGADKNNPNIRRFSVEQPSPSPKKTVPINRTFVSRPSLALRPCEDPEGEFLMTFPDDNDEHFVKKETDDTEAESMFCWCCKKQKK